VVAQHRPFSRAAQIPFHPGNDRRPGQYHHGFSSIGSTRASTQTAENWLAWRTPTTARLSGRVNKRPRMSGPFPGGARPSFDLNAAISHRCSPQVKAANADAFLSDATCPTSSPCHASTPSFGSSTIRHLRHAGPIRRVVSLTAAADYLVAGLCVDARPHRSGQPQVHRHVKTKSTSSGLVPALGYDTPRPVRGYHQGRLPGRHQGARRARRPGVHGCARTRPTKISFDPTASPRPVIDDPRTCPQRWRSSCRAASTAPSHDAADAGYFLPMYEPRPDRRARGHRGLTAGLYALMSYGLALVSGDEDHQSRPRRDHDAQRVRRPDLEPRVPLDPTPGRRRQRGRLFLARQWRCTACRAALRSTRRRSPHCCCSSRVAVRAEAAT